MLERAFIILLLFALFVLLFRYVKAKKQIKSIIRQLYENAPRRHSVSIELFDRDIEALALEINRLIDENNKMLLEEEKTNRYLKSSITDISHDMRTPLTSTIGYLQLLGRGDLDDSQRQYLNVALEKAQYLRELLSSFFELSTLDANDTVYDLKKVDLAGIVSETILDNSNEFAKKQIMPVFETTDKPVFIIGNTWLLQRAIQNIIVNCLDYSCGDVIFTISEHDTIRLTSENPVNNAEQIDIERVFDRFYKADYSRSGQGTGLGLSISKLLIEKMGGSVSAYIRSNAFVLQLEFPKLDE